MAVSRSVARSGRLASLLVRGGSVLAPRPFTISQGAGRVKLRSCQRRWSLTRYWGSFGRGSSETVQVKSKLYAELSLSHHKTNTSRAKVVLNALSIYLFSVPDWDYFSPVCFITAWWRFQGRKEQNEMNIKLFQIWSLWVTEVFTSNRFEKCEAIVALSLSICWFLLKAVKREPSSCYRVHADLLKPHWETISWKSIVQ